MREPRAESARQARSRPGAATARTGASEGWPAAASPGGLLDACLLLARSEGFDLRPPSPASPDGRPLSLGELCLASGLRHRRVTLRDGWWRRDNGPLLGLLRPAVGESVPRAVALLPRGRGYHLVEPASGASRTVDAAAAARLEPEAWVLYRPLPAGPLGLGDLLRAGLHGLGRDLIRLLTVTLCAGGLALLTPLVTRRIASSSIVNGDRLELAHLALALGVGALAAALFELSRGLTVIRLKGKTALSLQGGLWDRLLALPVSFYRRFTVGDLAGRSMGIDQVQNLLTADVTSAVFVLVWGGVSLASLFYYSPPLAWVVVGVATFLAASTALVAFRQLRRARVLLRLQGKLAGLVYALVGGIAKLRVSGAEGRAFVVWARQFAEQRRCSVAIQRLANVQTVLGSVFGMGASLAVMAAVGLSGRFAIGVADYLAFAAALAQFQAAALAAIGVLPTLLGFVPAYERMRPILQEAPESRAGQADPGPLRGEIELRGVDFRYADGPPVIEGLSLAVRPGEFVAIVGPSGSGKSTCLRLMLGFEQPVAGAVLVDGQSIADLDMHRLRRQFGVVLQHGHPLVGDLFHNIVGSLPLSLDDAWEAARLVGLEEEIRAMPMGMFTAVNQRGVSFSGGQRQRLLLARAIVNRPRLLLLDEATSALDNRTQDLVTRSLAGLGATRVVVAHRLSTISAADRIYVVEEGRVVQEGTFDQLMGRSGAFARLAERQRP